MLSNGLDGFKPAFSYAGIFLVCKLFLEGFDGSVEIVVRYSSKNLMCGLVSATVANHHGSLRKLK